MRDCIEEVKKASDGVLSEDDVNKIVDEINRRHKSRQKKNKAESVDESLAAVAEEMATEMELAAKVEKRNAALNVLVRRSIDERIALFPDASKGLRSLTVGTNDHVSGAKLSVDARKDALHAQYTGGLIHDLESAGLLEFLTRRSGPLGDGEGAIDFQIAREMWEIGREGGKPGITGSREAKQIAEIVHKWQEVARLRENRAGAFIRKAAGYVVRQSHDAVKIYKAGYEAWRAKILPLLDDEATFQGADVEKFLKGAYDGLVSGRHLKSGEPTFHDIAFKGPANLAKKVSQERVLHFKSAEDWYAYNKEFGARSLVEAIFSGLDQAARNTALMETFGPNPRAMFEAVRDTLADQSRGNPKVAKKLTGKLVENEFREIEGATRVSADPSVAAVAGAIRDVQSMAKLGGAVITSVTDIPAKASELRFQGQNLGAAYLNGLHSAIGGHSGRQSREIARLIGVGIDGVLGDVQARFSTSDGPRGMTSGLMRKYFKANLLTQWTDGQKRGAALMMANTLAKETGKEFGALKPRLQTALSLYEIGPREWNAIRAADIKAPDGNKYLTPDAIKDLPDAVLVEKLGIENATPYKISKARDALETKLRSYYFDRTETAIPTPGARERALMVMGQESGTALGEALRFMTQFKAFPIAIQTKVLGRELQGFGLKEGLLRGKGDVLGIAHYVAATTVFGMVAMEAKEIAKGRTPRDPFGEHWGKTWTQAFLQGGGLGIYGDFLFGEYNRFGGTPLETAAGPAIGTAADLLTLFAKIRAGDDSTAEAIRFVKGNTPFMNLFYTKLALDYLIIYNLQEMANPGYLRRMERRVERENDQTFILPPSEALGQ